MPVFSRFNKNKHFIGMGKGVLLPDFRNAGVIFRAVALAEALRFLLAYLIAGNVAAAYARILANSLVFEPALLLDILILYLLAPRLLTLPYRLGVFAVLLVSAGAATAWLFVQGLNNQEMGLPGLDFTAITAMVLAFTILAYFNWRQRTLSPAWSEARLMALQARIRPHFLFNSLNTVLGLIRAEPRRAEIVLENLSELYRALMSESSVLVPLESELDLARAYAEVEAVRLGERLDVEWRCQNAPMDALVPPMTLQPLVENAVYHGIEPLPSGGKIKVGIFAKDGQLNLIVRNPFKPDQPRHGGNRIALDNIRERLDLHFHAEARMRVYESGDEFIVQIRIPYRHG